METLPLPIASDTAAPRQAGDGDQALLIWHRLVDEYIALRSVGVTRAFALARKMYGQRMHPLLDMTLLEHTCGVLQLLMEFSADEETIITCLLQHVLYCDTSAAGRLEKDFGADVAGLVSKTHLLSHIGSVQGRKSADEVKAILLSLSGDIRPVLLKLCRRCFMMHNITSMPAGLRLQKARESLQIYAPVAARLGVYALKYRLEDTSFPICYPSDAENIQQQVKGLHLEYGIFLARVAAKLQAFLQQEGMPAEVMAREKHPYSIFCKMQKKSVTDIQKIQDLIAMRVLVRSVPDCYQTLGLLHRLATPITHRFKDYIAFPKPNGYQSLHTCLVGLPGAPSEVLMEIQIRTQDMHREAEYGVAAHWLYKEIPAARRPVRNRHAPHDTMMGDGDDPGDPAEFGLLDHIYVLTPRADIIELAEGSTPLDFAFALHTDIGLKFKSAKVNNAIVPLSHKLENGDVVEVLTHKHPRPSIQWLQKLSTASARSKLKAYFSAHHRAQFITRGRDSLNRELKTRGLPPLDADFSILRSFDAKPYTIHQREDLLVKIGLGSVRTSSVLRHLPLPALPGKGATLPKERQSRSRSIIQILGTDGTDMPVRFAKCCNADKLRPRPDIIGCITRQGEVNIHREACRMLKNANPERKVKVEWRM